MLKKTVFAAACFTMYIVFSQGCVYHKADEEYPFICDTTDVSYTDDIQLILRQNCGTSKCHQGDNCASGYNLFDHAVISDLALDGYFTYGTLLSAVMHEGGAEEMPKEKPKLQDCEINQIAAWVHAGAPNN